MFTKRSTNTFGRRLGIELLEGRDVPSTVTAPAPAIIDPTTTSTTSAVVVGQDQTPTDPAAGDTVLPSTALDGMPVVPPVDLAAFVTVDKLKPSIGDIVTVRVTIMNSSTDPATNVNVATTLPEGLTFVAAKPGQGTYDDSTRTWNAGTVLPGGPLSLIIKAKVTDSAAQDVSATIASADQPDPSADNNSADATVTPVLGRLTMTQTASSKTLTIGAVVTFTLAVKNAGPGMATGITIGEMLDPGLKFIKAQTPDHGAFNAKTMTWTMSALGAGKTATIRLVAIVEKTGALESTATLTGSTGVDTDNSMASAAGVVKGTTANTPSTWSYSLPGNTGAPGPMPVSIGPLVAKPLAVSTGSVQLAKVLQLSKPSV